MLNYKRYQRHFSVIGLDGQQQLNQARVCIVGLGGIGNPVSLYLAASGIGTLGLVDFDEVECSNLQRQILYTEKDIGKSKAQCTQKRLSELNSEINLITYQEKLNQTNAFEIFKSYDLIIDGTDNFTTRYLINDMACLMDKPFISASVLKDQAQLALFDPKISCFRCLYPNCPPEALVPNCSEAGVLGVTVGVTGTMASNLAINYLLNRIEPKTYSKTLWLYEANTLSWRTISFSKNTHCSSCQKKITNNLNQNTTKPKHHPTFIIETDQIINDALIIDVREPWEIAISPLPLEHINLPLRVIFEDSSVLDSLAHLKLKPIIFICKAGIRSLKAAEYFSKHGFTTLYNFSGGIDLYYQKYLGQISCY